MKVAPFSVRFWLLSLVLLAASAGSTSAASIVRVVTTGDAAPNGGVFAGPSFTAWPAAAGDGWVAARSRVETADGGTEALLLTHFTNPPARIEVVRLGDDSADGATFRQFFGRPAINRNGDVAFIASTSAPKTEDAPTPAGVFLYHRTPGVGQLQIEAVALSGQATAAGVLDIVGALEPLDDRTGVDSPSAGPVLNDRGDIAFLSAIQGSRAGGVLFLQSAGNTIAPVPVAVPGTLTSLGTLFRVGPPAMNQSGAIVFHGTVVQDDAAEGIFRVASGVIATIVKKGLQVEERDKDGNLAEQTFQEFGDALAIDDQGDVAFTASPPAPDEAPHAPETDEPPHALVYLAATDGVKAVAYPGRGVGSKDFIDGIVLGPAGRFAAATPSFTPSGDLVTYASLDGGSREGVLHVDITSTSSNEILVTSAGNTADPSPTGGTLNGLEGAPVSDGVGGIAYLARIAGGTAPEALLYRTVLGKTQAVGVGEGSPTSGYFAGTPFSAPHLNARGDTAFRAYVSRGPSSVVVVRTRNGSPAIIASAGDPSPRGAEHRYIDFLGTPTLDGSGNVAFSAQLLEAGRALLLADDAGPRILVEQGDDVPGAPTGSTFLSVGASPSFNDQGDLAFRATYREANDDASAFVVRQGLFLRRGGSIQLLARSGVAAPVDGSVFDSFRDPFLTGGDMLLFPASVRGTSPMTALFGFNRSMSVLVKPEDSLDAGSRIGELSGTPAGDASGNVTFLATRMLKGVDTGTALVRRIGTGLDVLAAPGSTGPFGGTYSSVGQPAVNATGDIAFLASFVSGTGGARGFLLYRTAGGYQQHLAAGDVAGEGVRFARFGSRSALAEGDLLAFTANLKGTDATSGVFLASPAALDVPSLTIRTPHTRHGDRIALSMTLTPGVLNDGMDLASETIVVSIADMTGSLFEQRLDKGALRKGHRRGQFKLQRVKRGAGIKRLLASLTDNGGVTASAVLRGLELTKFGTRPLVPPFQVTFAVGNDTGRASVPCLVTGLGAACVGTAAH